MEARFLSRAFVLAAVLVAALASWSCDGSSGFGMTPNTGARWGSGMSGAPIFVGGPSH